MGSGEAQAHGVKKAELLSKTRTQAENTSNISKDEKDLLSEDVGQHFPECEYLGPVVRVDYYKGY